MAAFVTIDNAYSIPYKNCSDGVSINGLFNYWYQGKHGYGDLTKILTNNSCNKAYYYIVRVYRIYHPFGHQKNTFNTRNDDAQHFTHENAHCFSTKA